VPPGKIAQAQALLIQGRSQREIGRTLHISPMTVAKIMKAEDFQAAITEARQQLFSQLPAIVNCVIRGAMTDPYLGYSLLKDIGVIAKYDSFIAPEKPAPSTEEERQQRQINAIAAVIQERRRVFGIQLPDEMEKAMEKVSEQG
jgi:predicted transcriptional regulator